jgi:hypothetical protein
MKHMQRRLCLLMAGAIAAVILHSCAPQPPLDTSQTLGAMGLNDATFSQFTTCRQIRILADVGSQHLDFDHGIVMVPAWMDTAIENQPRRQVAECISQEGSYRLALLRAHLSSTENTSFSIHALAYEAERLGLLEDVQVMSLLRSAVCDSNLEDEFALALRLYVGVKGKAPDYVGEQDASTRMRHDLCGQ